MLNKDKVLVLGRGFLGKSFERRGYTVWGRNDFEWNGRGFNGRMINRSDWDVVINTIGISDTRFCEDDENWELIKSVNGDLPRWLSESCFGNAQFVHISTGCLYDVRNKPQKETDFKAAHCNYVVSKWIGELGCNPDRDLIIRPRLLFDGRRDPNGRRNNLIVKMKGFRNFLAEYNTITSNDTIVEAIEALLDNDQCGVFNVGQTGEYTIADMARALDLPVDCELTQEQLHSSQGLFLVNNLMDLSKLRQYYEPRDALVELERCNMLLEMEGE